jgi:hypothetical protein
MANRGTKQARIYEDTLRVIDQIARARGISYADVVDNAVNLAYGDVVKVINNDLTRINKALDKAEGKHRSAA